MLIISWFTDCKLLFANDNCPNISVLLNLSCLVSAKNHINLNKFAALSCRFVCLFVNF